MRSRVNAGDVASPLGRRFPEVAGQALSRERVRLPGDLAGAPAVLLVAYERRTQDDIDRWGAFIEREAPGLAVYEVPTIPSLVWRPLSAWIDAGMRGGVPHELWSRVVTLYEDGAKVRAFLGHRSGGRAHVTLLDAGGLVRWFTAEGFSEAAGRGLLRALAELPDRGPASEEGET
jgi:hypothetical protein